MKTDKKTNLLTKYFLLVLICLITLCSHSLATADASEWRYGIGTGIFMLNMEGDIGFNTNLAGAVEFNDIDLSPDDINDLMSSAFGFGGYAYNGTWLIDYSFSYLKLEDETSQGLVTLAEFEYELSGAELMVGYPIYKTSSIVMRIYGGLRYTNHDLFTSVTIGGATVTSQVDNDWVDGLIGVSGDITMAEKWTWNNRFNAGFGGSEGTYSVHSGIRWRFHENWTTSVYGKYTAVEFENGNKGDNDWYLYDIDEFGVGINLLFHW